MDLVVVWRDRALLAERTLRERRTRGGECTECQGSGDEMVDSGTLYGIPGGYDVGGPCPACEGTGSGMAQARLAATDKALGEALMRTRLALTALDVAEVELDAGATEAKRVLSALCAVLVEAGAIDPMEAL